MALMLDFAGLEWESFDDLVFFANHSKDTLIYALEVFFFFFFKFGLKSLILTLDLVFFLERCT